MACGNASGDLLALWRKRQVWLYRVQPQGTMPDLRGFGKGVVDSVNGAMSRRQLILKITLFFRYLEKHRKSGGGLGGCPAKKS